MATIRSPSRTPAFQAGVPTTTCLTTAPLGASPMSRPMPPGGLVTTVMTGGSVRLLSDAGRLERHLWKSVNPFRGLLCLSSKVVSGGPAGTTSGASIRTEAAQVFRRYEEAFIFSLLRIHPTFVLRQGGPSASSMEQRSNPAIACSTLVRKSVSVHAPRPP